MPVFAVFESMVVVTAGAVRQLASAKQAAAGRQQQERARAITREMPCPKCKHPELEYYTMQLRSADEGQTVFYECRKCGHAFSQNT